jgi:hypothetical protein
MEKDSWRRVSRPSSQSSSSGKSSWTSPPLSSSASPFIPSSSRHTSSQPSHSHSHSHFPFSSSYSSSKPSSTLPSLSLDTLSLNEIYEGKVWNVLTTGKQSGMYIKYGKDGKWFEKDGYIKHIVYKPNGRLYSRGDKIQVKCIRLNPTVQLVLLPQYVRPLLIVDVNGPLGNRAPFDPNHGCRIFVPRPYCQEFLNLCSQYYEIAVWSCARRNNIELELFTDINLFFIWSQEESTSLYPRTSFVSPAKVFHPID